MRKKGRVAKKVPTSAFCGVVVCTCLKRRAHCTRYYFCVWCQLLFVLLLAALVLVAVCCCVFVWQAEARHPFTELKGKGWLCESVCVCLLVCDSS